MLSESGDPRIRAWPPSAAAVEHVGEELARSRKGTLGETQVMQPGRRTDGVNYDERWSRAGAQAPPNHGIPPTAFGRG
jgi:hypothetical protein